MRRVDIKENETLFKKGDDAGDAYLIITGSIKVSAPGMTAVLRKNELFGESGLTGNPRMATTTALEDCHLLAFSVDELRNTIRADPDTAESLVEVMIRRLAHTVSELEKRISRESR